MLYWFWGFQGVKYFMSYELPGNAVFHWVDFNSNLCEQNNLGCVSESWHTFLPTSKMCDLRLDAVLISATSMTFLTQESSNAMHTDFLSPKGWLLCLTNYRDLIYNKQMWSKWCNKWRNTCSMGRYHHEQCNVEQVMPSLWTSSISSQGLELHAVGKCWKGTYKCHSAGQDIWEAPSTSYCWWFVDCPHLWTMVHRDAAESPLSHRL